MPDSNDTFDVTIRTQADLSGAQAVETELQRNANLSRGLNEQLRESEALLANVRKNTEASPAETGLAAFFKNLVLDPIRQIKARLAESNSPAPGSTPSDTSDSSVNPIPDRPANVISSPASNPNPSPFSSADFSIPSAVQTQIQHSHADQMRAALEENSRMTTTLYQQLLEIMSSQNQKLGALDRRVNELGNQIKSLKNP